MTREDHPIESSDRDGEQPRDAPSPIDASRLAMMRRVKQLSVAERIGLLDRMCREQTRIAISARRVR